MSDWLDLEDIQVTMSRNAISKLKDKGADFKAILSLPLVFEVTKTAKFAEEDFKIYGQLDQISWFNN